MITVKDIVKEYLIEHGFDGLCTDECGCGVEDLFPCGNECLLDCEPAYETTCDKCPINTDTCPYAEDVKADMGVCYTTKKETEDE